MKKVLKKITAFLMSGLMLFGSTYMAVGSASAANNEIQSKGTDYVYGDVNNDGEIDISDVISVNKAIVTFNDLTDSSELPWEFAVARPSVYFKNQNYVSQAVDIDGDGYITKQDSEMIMKCIVRLEVETGRCGQNFYIN